MAFLFFSCSVVPYGSQTGIIPVRDPQRSPHLHNCYDSGSVPPPPVALATGFLGLFPRFLSGVQP